MLTDARGFSPPPAAPFPKQVMQGYARKLARYEPVSKLVGNILSSEGVERSKQSDVLLGIQVESLPNVPFGL